jgi:hypothetical protein
MAKNPLITDEVKRVIAQMYLKHSDWRAKEIRDGVEARLHEQNPRSKPGWPGLSTVQKELTKQRKTDDTRPPESKGLDEPWNIATMADADNEIPAEALPIVLRVWAKSFERKGKSLTIREAKWVSRLYHLINDIDSLKWYAKFYALEERTTEITGKSPENPFYYTCEDGILWHELTGENPLIGFFPPSDTPIGISYEGPPKGVKEEEWVIKLQERISNESARLIRENEEAEKVEKEKIQQGMDESEILLGKALRVFKKEAQNERVNKGKR